MLTPKFIPLEIVIKIHNDQIKEYGGCDGIRDQGLLESALAQPEATFDGQLLHPNLAAQAAAYLFSLVKNHPFIDGNKRTAFEVMVTFLRVNAHTLTLSQDEAYQLVIDIAESKLDKKAITAYLEMAISPQNDRNNH